jgi:nucleotide-binding universal stress UspA family protein
MYRHLLVPLDGSRLAESVLPVAASLAGGFQATVTLLHVIERGPPAHVHGDRHLTGRGEAEAYLDDLARRFFPPGVRVSHHVHGDVEADVPGSIVRHARELGADLVVMCTHGRGRLRHQLFGGIAQRVLAAGAVPVLLVPPVEAPTPPFSCRRVLVPLDGRPEHAQGLPVGVAFARACAAAVHVLWVVPTFAHLAGEQAVAGHLLPGTISALLEMEQEEAARAVRERLAALGATDIPTTVEVARGDPAAAIMATATRIAADLIVIGTHGRAGMDAFWAGSVAPHIALRAAWPLLLVPLEAGP